MVFLITWAQKHYMFSQLKYNVLLDNFSSPLELPDLQFFSLNSELKSIITKYQFPNRLLKVIPMKEGICFKPDLKIEFPLIFKPVLIPWKNLEIERASEADGFGLDKYNVFIENELVFCYMVNKDILMEMSIKSNQFRENYKGNHLSFPASSAGNASLRL